MKVALASPDDSSKTRPGIHPPFSDELTSAICRALQKAWDSLKLSSEDREVLETGRETRITQRLEKKLNHLRVHGGVDGYNCNTFERPHVGSEYLNYEDVKVRKPDIIFGVSGSPRIGVIDDMYDAMFVECKLLDQGKNFGLYCSKGLAKFVDGSYAWRMPEAMMVAYVRTGQRLPDDLVDGFATFKRGESYSLIGEVRPCNICEGDNPVFVSEHGRTWPLPDGANPGPIAVRHLWLAVYPSK